MPDETAELLPGTLDLLILKAVRCMATGSFSGSGKFPGKDFKSSLTLQNSFMMCNGMALSTL